MDSQHATDIVHRIFEDGFARGDFEGLHRHVAEEYIDHSPIPATAPGPAGFEARIVAMRSAFGDFEVGIEDVSVDGDRVWFRWSLRGHHIGPFAGIEPTGRPVTVEGINLEKMEGDRVVEHFSQFDRMGLIQQLRD
jgi:predicted ester cyclase